MAEEEEAQWVEVVEADVVQAVAVDGKGMDSLLSRKFALVYAHL